MSNRNRIKLSKDVRFNWNEGGRGTCRAAIMLNDKIVWLGQVRHIVSLDAELECEGAYQEADEKLQAVFHDLFNPPDS